MNKKLLPIIIGALLLLGAAGYYVFVVSGDDNSSPATEEITDSSPLFNTTISYPVTITGTISDSTTPSKNQTLVLHMQDENTWSYVFDSNAGSTTMIKSSGYIYLQSPGTDQWTKVPVSQSSSSEPNMFINQEDIGQYSDSATYSGEESCSQGTCQVWQWTDPTDSTSTMKIKISGGHVVEITSVTGTTSTTLSYDYQSPVDIKIPTNALELNLNQ